MIAERCPQRAAAWNPRPKRSRGRFRGPFCRSYNWSWAVVRSTVPMLNGCPSRRHRGKPTTWC